jgi:hypothetical protein
VKLAALLLLPGVMTVQAAAGQSPTTASESFLLRTSEWHTTLKPTAGPNNVGNCMIVYPDGRLHLELRRQEFFSGPASFVSYEGNLSIHELTSLRSILDSDAVTSLQAVHPPSAPMDADDYGWFRAEIWRPTRMQTVGTVTWHGGTGPKNTEDDARAWREAGVALQPLIDWSHLIKSDRPELRRIPNSDSVCGQ